MTNAAVVRLCGVPARPPRVSERNPHRRQARAAGRSHQPLRRVPHGARRDEGRTARDRHAAAIVVALEGVGPDSPPQPRWSLSVLYVGRDTIDAWMAPGGPRATVVSAGGGLYRLSGGALEAGAAIGEKERIRTGPGAHAVLRLADGSTVDVNERTELFVTAAWSGQSIHLQRGDVIVQAAKQRRGHLRVLTRDSIASVKGTVFAVSAGMGGSVVSVVEGSVAVNQPGREVLLSPGQQAASNPGAGDVGGPGHLLEPGRGAVPAAPRVASPRSNVRLRRSRVRCARPPALLSYLPAGAFVYGAVPNLGGKIGEGLAAAEQQAFENAAFRAWWNSETGLELRRIVDRVQSVSSMLGDEVVFSVASAGPARRSADGDGARAGQASERRSRARSTGSSPTPARSSRPYSVSDELMVVSDSPSHLAWALSHLGQGAGSPFAAAIGDRYKRGAGWLIGVDAAPVIAMASEDDAPPIEFAAHDGCEVPVPRAAFPGGSGRERGHGDVRGRVEKGWRRGWLTAGSGGAAEYLPADALVAGYVSMREPGQLFQEFTALMTKEQPSFQGDLTTAGRETRRRLRREPDGGDGNRSGVRAARILRERPDVDDGRAGERPGGHRQLASRSWWTPFNAELTATSRTSEASSDRRARADGRGTR